MPMKHGLCRRAVAAVAVAVAFVSPTIAGPWQEQYDARLQALASAPLVQAAAAVDTAIVNVNVLTMRSADVLPRQTVLVKAGRIAAIGSAGRLLPEPGMRIVDGNGGYLLPGLADMHVHSQGNPMSLLLFLANGVTTVRQMSGLPVYIEWAQRAAAGEILAPDLYSTGPILGEARAPEGAAANPEGLAALVQAQHAAGYRAIKPYTYLSAPDYRAALTTAKRLGMYAVGHVPYSVGTVGAIEAGQDEVAHVHSFHQDYFRDFDPAHVFREYAVDEAFGERAAPLLRRAGTAVTTTLIVDQALADAQDVDAYIGRPEMAFETPGAAALMRSTEWTFRRLWPRDYLTRVYLPHLFRLTRTLGQNGVLLVLGTDSGVTGMLHGFSAHRELQLLVQAGLSPYEALLTATRNAAAAAGSEDWGAIEPGRRADLLLLRDNPLENIGNTRRIAGVMKRGRWLDRGELDRLLEKVREAYQ
jgi:imidazolonepropionase-like amidohydrolase